MKEKKRKRNIKFKRKTKHKKKNKIHKKKTKKKQRGGSVNQSVEVEPDCDIPEYIPELCISHRIFENMQKVEEKHKRMDNRDVMNKGYCMGNALGGRIFRDMIEDKKYEKYFGEYSKERLDEYKCPMLYTNLVELVSQESVKSNHSQLLWPQKKRHCIEHGGKCYMFYCPYHLALELRGLVGMGGEDLQIRDTFNEQIEKVEHCRDYNPIRHPDIETYIKDTVDNCPLIKPIDIPKRTTCVSRDTGCVIS